MKPCLYSHVVLSLVAFLAAFPVRGEEPAASSAAKSVTVFPIILNTGKPIVGVSADMSRNITELVGLFLERGGVEEVEIAKAEFTPPEKANLPKVAEAFGQFVQSQKLGTEYAFYGQFVGTPGKGVDKIQLVVTDQRGKVVLAMHLGREQPVVKRLLGGEKKVCPMTASYYMVCQLREFWGLADPEEKDAPEGKMAKLWAEKSGLPPKSEREAIESRLNAVKKTFKTSTVAVYPIRVESGTQVAARLAEMLTQEGLCRAEASSTDPKLPIQGSTNQTRILWDTARAFRDFLRKNPPAADYALFANYGIGRSSDGKTVVGGIQFILCDRSGDWVLLELQNDHHSDFQRIDPQSPDDCNRLVTESLKNRLY